MTDNVELIARILKTMAYLDDELSQVWSWDTEERERIQAQIDQLQARYDELMEV